jgi:hypothetical protein
MLIILRSICNIVIVVCAARFLSEIQSIHDLLVLIGTMMVGFFLLLEDKISDIKCKK